MSEGGKQNLEEAGGFFSRWSQRKQAVKQGAPLAEPLPKTPEPISKQTNELATPPNKAMGAKDQTAQTPEPVKALTLEDVAKLTPESDFTAYMTQGVSPEVRNAAMKKLLADPHYNIMDGLDIYIDDYSKTDPIPLEMLKSMNQSKMLGLFKTDEEKLADEEAERIERADYHERLKVLEDKEAADEKAIADANSETDVSPSAINAENSAKSPDSAELNESQESTEVPAVNAEIKIDLKTQTKT